MKHRIHELNVLERLSGGDTCIHRLHPTVKLFATAVFVITVISFDRYDIKRLVPYIFYPSILMALSDTPYSMLLKRFMIAFPFCFFAGISNVIFVPEPYGVISFFSIMFRTYLCVMAVLLLVAATPFFEIANSMRALKIPNIFIVTLEITYRYLCLLLEEAYSMYIAYSLRSPNSKGIKIKDMGSFAGILLLRSFDRADRIYSAMKCRGYATNALPQNSKIFMPRDFIFLAIVCFSCITLRI